jgi:hypothetical protein
MTALYDARLVDAFEHLPEEIDDDFDRKNEADLDLALDWRSAKHRRFAPLFLHLRGTPFPRR